MFKKLSKRYFSNKLKAFLEVTIIGNPNAGKSTLFNNLTNSNSVLVHP